MKVAEIVAYRVRIPLVKRIKHASHTRTDTENIIVRVRLDNQQVGWGEGVPRDYVTGETAESGLALLKQSDFRSQLNSAASFEDSLPMIERIRLAAVPGDARGIVGNAVRCAVETALLDAYGRAFGEPLCNVVKLLAPELYQFRNRVQYSGAITSARKGMKLRFAAWRWRVFGSRQVKVKVGIEGHDDPYRLRMIRSRSGRRMDLRIDANEAWPADQAVAKIQALEPYGISSVEQPVSHEEAGRLSAIRREIRTPVMLDESLCGMKDAQDAVDGGWCDAFNLRISKCGGFIPTIRLAQFAVKCGITYQLGCQVGESAILSAAGRQLATGLKGLTAIEGSFDRYLVRHPLSTEDITFGWGGHAPALVRTGLSVGIDGELVERLATHRETLLD